MSVEQYHYFFDNGVFYKKISFEIKHPHLVQMMADYYVLFPYPLQLYEKSPIRPIRFIIHYNMLLDTKPNNLFIQKY